MKLIDLLHQRREMAEKFTKENFQDRVKEDLKFYNADPPDFSDRLNIDLTEAVNRRYMFNIPLVFTNHEAMMSSMFDRLPDLIIYQRGEEDRDKEIKVKAVYEYLKDKLDLEMFATDAAWWMLLSGFTSAHIGYAQKVVEKPLLDDITGEPVLREDGTPMTYPEYVYDDPTLEVGDPKKEYYSPESEFKIDATTVPYYFRKKLLTPDVIKRLYGKDVDADSTIADDSEEKSKETETAAKDNDRTKTWFYYGTLPKMVKGEVKNWDAEKIYYIILTSKEILYKGEAPLGQKTCRISKLYGAPNTFFGFGLGKLLAPFQREKSVRRGQMVRYADVAAYPKLVLFNDTEMDKNTYRDPREGLVLTVVGDRAPEYLSPPNLSQVVSDTNQLADQDAQQASGLLDITQGAQNTSTVKTATGQSIFADAAEKRVRFAKKKFMKFYREVVILLLKMCQENWESDKLINITDDNGESMQVSVGSVDLESIDFDMDIDVDIEGVSVNKDVLRAQAIELYNLTKDDPMANRKETLKFAYEQGFEVRDPERFLADPVAEAGTALVNPATGEQFIVDESGNLTTPDTMENLAQPGGDQMAASQPGIMGGVQPGV